MPRLVFPFSGPCSKCSSKLLGAVVWWTTTVPSYAAPMAMVVKRLPRTTIRAAPPDIFRPSISRCTMVQVPCNISRSRSMDSLLLPPKDNSDYTRLTRPGEAEEECPHEWGRPRGHPEWKATLPPRLLHTPQNLFAIGVHARRLAAQWGGDHSSQARRLIAIHPGRWNAIPGSRRRFRSVNARAPFDHIQIQFQDALLGQDAFRERRQRELHGFAQHAAAGGEEQVLDQLLCNGGTAAAQPPIFHVLVHHLLHLLPIDAVVLEETAILGPNDGVLQVARNAP